MSMTGMREPECPRTVEAYVEGSTRTQTPCSAMTMSEIARAYLVRTLKRLGYADAAMRESRRDFGSSWSCSCCASLSMSGTMASMGWKKNEGANLRSTE